MFKAADLWGVFRVRCEHAERLQQPGGLVIANHPSLIDALCFMSLMPQVDVVVKANHYKNFFLAGPIKGAGYIPNTDGPRLVEACVDRLNRGRSVIVFPEGTRSPVDGLGPFARGFAHVALRSGCDLIPVTITCRPATLYRGKAWWDVPEGTFTVNLAVDEPLVVKDVVRETMPMPLAARTLTTALRDHFERRLIVA